MIGNTAIILAAGAGIRMKSRIPKVLHQVCGRTMLEQVIRQVKLCGMKDVIVVVGHGSEEVMAACADMDVKFALQKEQLGTGHAVMQAADFIPGEGDVIILCGDTPLIRCQTLQDFIKAHHQSRNDGTVLTADLEDPFGYGRIVKDEKGNLKKIVEQKDASDVEKTVSEINSGVFCFKADLLKANLARLNTNNAQDEYYITDVISLAASEGKRAGIYKIKDADEIMGINNRIQLALAEKIMQSRIVEKLMLDGVTFIDKESTYIEDSVEIGMDTIVYPGAILKGKTRIGESCIIGQNSRIEDSTVGDFVEIQSSVIIKSSVGDQSTIGPFAYLRPGSQLGRHVKIGDFVEVKNAAIGNYSKASHLSYIGDADVSSHVNIGCGVVFVNYDGKKKYRSIILSGAFIGSNSNVVAPVTVGENAYIAAGTTVTRDVPSGALCLGRVKEKHIEGWVARKQLLKNQKED